MGARSAKQQQLNSLDDYRWEKYPKDIKVVHRPGVERALSDQEYQNLRAVHSKHKKRRKQVLACKDATTTTNSSNNDKSSASIIKAKHASPNKHHQKRGETYSNAVDKSDSISSEAATSGGVEGLVQGRGVTDKKQEHLMAVSWGWGGEGRTGRGTFTYQEVGPHLVVNNQRVVFVDVAAGKHHSLLVSNEGVVYSTGHGRREQLGAHKMGYHQVVLRRMPRPVLPSGELKRGADYQIAQVAAGAGTSYAREVGEDEASRTVEGLTSTIRAIDYLLSQHQNNYNLLELRAYLIEEAKTLGRKYGGAVFSWGSSGYGALGLGVGVVQCEKPALISSLRDKRVRRVAAGREHVLASTYNGEVYVWGRGKHGRLGLGDYEDRWEPVLLPPPAGCPKGSTGVVGAGHCHSLAVFLSDDGVRGPRHRVYCWGKGANGRLGNSRSLDRNTPQLVELLPESIKGFSIDKASLGGAHTMVALSKEIKVTLGNPWGRVTRVYSWGANVHGQLGIDNTQDYSSPQRVWLPEYEVVADISAGKVHSCALNVYGEMFAWGRGFYGDHGLDDQAQRLKPTKLSSERTWLKVAGADYHSIALTLKHRPVSRREMEKSKLDFRDPNAYLGLARIRPAAIHSWVCIRTCKLSTAVSDPHEQPRIELFSCKTCNLWCVCKACMHKCHAGHDLEVATLSQPRVLCQCGIDPSTCELLPVTREPPGGDALKRLALIIQRLVRGYHVRKLMRLYRARRIAARRRACEDAWYSNIIKPILARVAAIREKHFIEYENACMKEAESHSIRALQYLKLQKGLQLLDSQAKALHNYLNTKGTGWPPAALRRMVPELPPFRYFTTRQQFRQILRQVPLRLHPSHKKLIQLTKDIPAYGELSLAEHMTHDPDLVRLVFASRGIKARADRGSLAALEGLYARLRKFEIAYNMKADRARRFSFDVSARVDKVSTAIDKSSREAMGEYISGIEDSLELARSNSMLAEHVVQNLSRDAYLGSPEGSRSYQAFISKYASPGLDCDLRDIMTTPHRPFVTAGDLPLLPERRRRYSFAAPERLHRSRTLWETAAKDEEMIQEAASRCCYPTRRQSWTWRMDKTGEHDRWAKAELIDWEHESARLEIVAANHGWELHIPETAKEDKKETKEEERSALVVSPLAASASASCTDDTSDGLAALDEASNAVTKSSPWQAFQDEDGHWYYYNSETQASQWEPPSDLYSNGGSNEEDQGALVLASPSQPRELTTEDANSQLQDSLASGRTAYKGPDSCQDYGMMPYNAAGATAVGTYSYMRDTSNIFNMQPYPKSQQAISDNHAFGTSYNCSSKVDPASCVTTAAAMVQDGYSGDQYQDPSQAWVQCQDSNGNWYWYNTRTGDFQYV